ncbi:MAG: hypothetical protein JSS14_28480 [Proteobacteria bacterium]|nr:hypothetical protein [Pseudomonadota bacterium]
MARPASSEVPSCINCAALSPTQYAGQGVGIGEKTNSSAGARDVPVYIRGLNGQQVTLVFSNDSGNPEASAVSSHRLRRAL